MGVSSRKFVEFQPSDHFWSTFRHREAVIAIIKADGSMMRILQAILITLAIIVCCVMTDIHTGYNPKATMVIITSVWVAYDSVQIQLRTYKSGISYGPVVLFATCVILWLVAFPWYLVVRQKIKSGAAIRRDEALAGPA
jgi:hypothetical protein